MKLEELELMDRILPKGSLWNLLEIKESQYFKGKNSILLEHQGVQFKIEIQNNLEILKIDTNIFMYHDLKNYIKVQSFWRGFYILLEKYFTNTLKENGPAMNAIMELVKYTGGPAFMHSSPYTASLLDQSNTLFVPVSHNIKIEYFK